MMTTKPVKAPRAKKVQPKVEPIEDIQIKTTLPRFIVSSMSVFEGQTIRITPHIFSSKKPKTYVWMKGGSEMQQEKGASLVFTASDSTVGGFVFSVTYEDGTSETTSNVCVVTLEANKPYINPINHIKYNEFHKAGFGKVNFNVVDKVDALLLQVETDNNLVNALAAVISNHPLKVDTDLLEIHSALCYCGGSIVVQESRDGYFEVYHADSNKTDYEKHKLGRMVNYWKGVNMYDRRNMKGFTRG